MDSRDAPAAVSERYATVADNARADAERLQARWAESGDAARARLAGRMAELLTKERDAARLGVLPPRGDFGFALTRFAGDVEWGPEGEALVDRLYELQRLWAET
jgi:hypothetical protein